MKRKFYILSTVLILSIVGCAKKEPAKKRLEWDYIEQSPLASDKILSEMKNNLDFEELMKVNVEGSIMLNGADLSEYKLNKYYDQLEIANWGSKTIWPASSSLPKAFNPKKIMKVGKNPGLGIRELHAQGITGESIGIGIIDGPLFTEHKEYKDQLHFYAEYNKKDDNDYADEHASAVSSIAVGKNVGVAPKANLFFINECMFNEEASQSQINSALAKDIMRFVKLNKTLPANKKIRVISISAAFYMQDEHYEDVEEAITKAASDNIAVLSSNEYSKDFAMGLSRLFYGNPDDYNSYIPASYMSYANTGALPRYRESKLIVPMERRTFASSTGAHDYQYESIGGVSWSIPYVAGVYALACQQQPDITYDEFIQIANETAVPLKTIYDNEEYTFEKIISPKNIIEYLQNNK